METNVKPKNKELVAAAGTEYIAYVDGDVTVSVKEVSSGTASDFEERVPPLPFQRAEIGWLSPR